MPPLLRRPLIPIVGLGQFQTDLKRPPQAKLTANHPSIEFAQLPLQDKPFGLLTKLLSVTILIKERRLRMLDIQPKFSVGLWAFGKSPDRFVPTGYHEDIPPSKQLEIARTVKGLDGLELFYPWSFEDVSIDEMKKFLRESGLGCAAIGVAVFDDKRWQDGSYGSHIDSIRDEAIALTKKTIDIAEELGTKTVNLWLGQDGYDYCFEIDYPSYWSRVIDAIKECADYNPSINLALEYKIKEPKIFETVGSIGKAILITKLVDRPNVGINIDTGHAFNAQENPAESVFLAAKYSKLLHLHIDDNYGEWDNDLVVGSVHFWSFVEMFFWLNELGYDGWLGLDLHPFRLDPVKATELSIRNVKRMLDLVDRVDKEAVRQCLLNQDYIGAMEVFERVM